MNTWMGVVMEIQLSALFKKLKNVIRGVPSKKIRMSLPLLLVWGTDYRVPFSF